MADAPKQPRKWKRWVLAALALVGIALVWAGRSRFQPDPLPNPNAYDDLVAAAKLLQGDLQKSVGDETTETLQAFVNDNAEAWKRAQVGLEREARVTLPAQPTAQDAQALMDRLGTLRRLARLFQARAVVAERDGRTLDAAHGFRDEIRLGRSFIPGGLFNDRLVGRVYEEQGAEGLARQIDKLSAVEARPLASEIEALESGQEPAERLFDRDLAFSLSQQGMQMRVVWMLNGGNFRALLKPAQDAVVLADRRASAKLRALAALLALRAWRLEHPDLPHPQSLDVLLPDYLRTVPDDPFGKGPLRLKFTDEHALVYSIGPDGRDDGGQPLQRGANPPTGDVSLQR